MTEPTASTPPTATSEETAEQGWVTGPGADGRLLSVALAWREGDVYVIRSSEFDVTAEDEDFDRALDIFVTWLIDRTALLAELVERGEATDDEARMFATLSARLFPLLHAAEQQERRRHVRRRRASPAHWRLQGTQASSSGRLSAA